MPDEPGKFDFYVLALSWSPSYCETAGRRGDRQQCGGTRNYAFVVHGLWPQREKGWSEFCSEQRIPLPRTMADGMLDIMPSRQLVYLQWDKHGTCSGLGQQGYFDKLRLARSLVKIPAAFEGIDKDVTTSPAAMEQAFIAENPGMPADGVSVVCDRRLLREIRICMDKDLKFRSCPDVDKRACSAQSIMMPPQRGAAPPSEEPAAQP